MQYLSPELNISKLYDLYVNDFCVRNQVDNPATQSINQSINQRNFYSAPYKTWTAALDNVNKCQHTELMTLKAS